MAEEGCCGYGEKGEESVETKERMGADGFGSGLSPEREGKYGGVEGLQLPMGAGGCSPIFFRRNAFFLGFFRGGN